MKAMLIILCAISAMSAVGADKKPLGKKTSLSAAELRTLATTEPNVKNASMLHFVAMATSNNVERKQKYLKAAASCLIACDKKDIYEKRIKGRLLNAAEFEGGLKENCKQCSGAGMKDRRCFVCNGSGRCSSCKGSGELVKMGFDRNNATKPCHKCYGNGRCHKCGGERSIKEKCMTCSGRGKVLRKEVAARAYRDLCNAVADNMAAEVRAKVEAEDRRCRRKEEEATAKVEAEERRRKREAAEEKARIERELMEALGLVDIYGKWMTPGSVRNVRYRVVQIYETGHALCTDGDRVFCLIFSSSANENAAEGDIYVNDLYRCGTYSYITVNNAPRTVAKFAIDLSVAQEEIKKQERRRLSR